LHFISSTAFGVFFQPEVDKDGNFDFNKVGSNRQLFEGGDLKIQDGARLKKQ
jgi:hypothetical protein